MGHADHDFLDAELAAALQDLLEAGISDSPPSRPKRLVPTNLTSRKRSRPSASMTRSQDRAAAFDGELGVVLDVLDALLDPRLLVGIGDVHVLDADLAAVGLAQAVHDLAQGRASPRPSEPKIRIGRSQSASVKP